MLMLYDIKKLLDDGVVLNAVPAFLNGNNAVNPFKAADDRSVVIRLPPRALAFIPAGFYPVWWVFHGAAKLKKADSNHIGSIITLTLFSKDWHQGIDDARQRECDVVAMQHNANCFAKKSGSMWQRWYSRAGDMIKSL